MFLFLMYDVFTKNFIVMFGSVETDTCADCIKLNENINVEEDIEKK